MGNTVQVKEPSAPSIAKLAVTNAITPRTQGDRAPLSFAQQQIWLHTQMVPGIPVYNEPVTVHRQGTLDVHALELALTEIVRRHQAWRTTVAVAEAEPMQVIGPPAPVTVPFIDLSQLPAEERELEAHRLAVQDAMRPFD